ncbi:hypothetical protein VNO77_37265 [Canavalia gladiata]|uniref:Uncharacterized protein n=1 Tax=Canavalia gladiata TaxID=3824 RepID=A0AAN9K8R9_CANGL
MKRHATKLEVRFMAIVSGNNSLVEVKQPLSLPGCELDKGFRPRKFEYHPFNSCSMCFWVSVGKRTSDYGPSKLYINDHIPKEITLPMNYFLQVATQKMLL